MTDSTFPRPHRVLVTGSTGKTGRRVAAALSGRGIPVRAASRRAADPDDRFDWYDENSWRRALAGTDAVYLTYQPDLAVPGAADAVGAFAALAAAHGVGRVVLLSGRGEPGAAASEAALLAAVPSATVLRCSWFDQNFTEGALRDAVTAGVLALPAPAHRREPFLDADDIADCAVAVLTDAPRPGAVFELTGPDSPTLAEVCAVLGAAAGRPVAYQAVGAAEFTDALAAQGLPDVEAAFLAGLFAEVLDGRNSATTDGVTRLLGRPARSFAEFARAVARSGAWATDAARG
ncbi:NAD(P)H-binding protein [Micromonospora sp. NPDC050686]|uniref:NAD(P)H-binding protein n=1 Tax=Micromonospora sp. NPDC050686 TaxID=3154631 RepID=UPI0033DDA265